jgi:acetylornithine aminotransferase
MKTNEMDDVNQTTTISQQLTSHHGEVMMGSYASPLTVLERGEGCHVWDVDGKRYLDFLGGIAVNSLGYAHPALVDAVSNQIRTLSHVSNYFATPPQLGLADRLLRITGAGQGGRVYFGNSGAEAMEAAFKLARLNSGGTRTRIITLRDSFHGRTMGSLALTGKPSIQEAFLPMPGGVEHIDSTVAALEAAIDDTVAALIFEPIKGEAGVVDLPEGFVTRARELTQQHGALLIIDEIQTGIGRTGEWFAYQSHGILPDAVAIAKGLGGGVPIGALVTFGRASELYRPGHHGSTFGGNPLVTAAGNAVLDEIERADLLGNARRRGAQLREGITALGSPLVEQVRGRGLLMGVGLSAPRSKEVMAAALQRGLIVNAANDSSIRIAPPLVVGDSEVAEFLELFADALAAVA